MNSWENKQLLRQFYDHCSKNLFFSIDYFQIMFLVLSIFSNAQLDFRDSNEIELSDAPHPVADFDEPWLKEAIGTTVLHIFHILANIFTRAPKRKPRDGMSD